MLSAKDVGYRVNGTWLVRDVSFDARPGEFWAVLGANGAGKSTLLRLLSGELRAHAGSVEYGGCSIDSHDPRQLASIRGCLAQERQSSFPYTAFEMAMMGRLPWQATWFTSPKDRETAHRSLERCGAGHLEARLYPSLSGGEKSRVDMARVFSQEPQVLLLDEPTNHLDPQHQFALLRLCREHADQGGLVIAVLHDLNLAACHADALLVLHNGAQAACGTPEEVLTPETIESCFDLECVIWRHPNGGPWVVPLNAPRAGSHQLTTTG